MGKEFSIAVHSLYCRSLPHSNATIPFILHSSNTWNHEHIALLGRILTSPEKEGHRIARHLADYVLIWAGGGGDDLAKSPHLVRIANSVYRFMCTEPTCRSFGMMVGPHISRVSNISTFYLKLSLCF
jgi:hypothetical protein